MEFLESGILESSNPGILESGILESLESLESWNPGILEFLES